MCGGFKTGFGTALKDLIGVACSLQSSPTHEFCNFSLPQPILLTILQEVWVSEKRIAYNHFPWHNNHFSLYFIFNMHTSFT